MGKLCGFLFALGVASGLSAPARAAELSARGPEQCPDAAELGFRVERALGASLARSAALRFHVVFEAPAAPANEYTARLEVQGEDQPTERARRVIRGRDCGRLGDAVSVAIALAIESKQPEATQIEPEQAAPAPPGDAGLSQRARAQAAPSTTPTDALSKPAVPPGEAAAWAPALALSVLVDSGSLPAPGLGVGLGAELRAEHLALRASGTLLFDQRVALELSGAPGAQMSLLIGGLSACTVPVGSYRASFAGFACAGWELGRLGAVGTGVQTSRRGSQLWSAPRIDLGLSWAIPGSAFRLGVQLSGVAPLKRDDFFLRELGSVHRPPGAVGRLALGLDIGFE